MRFWTRATKDIYLMYFYFPVEEISYKCLHLQKMIRDFKEVNNVLKV